MIQLFHYLNKNISLFNKQFVVLDNKNVQEATVLSKKSFRYCFLRKKYKHVRQLLITN